MTTLQGALWLIEHGFAVFAADHPGTPRCTGLHARQNCDGSRGKHPTVPFTRVHTRDAAQVRRWFGGEPRNVAVAVGAYEGPGNERLVVIDSDRPGAIEDVAEHFGHPHTPTTRWNTAKGHHDCYLIPPGIRLGNGLGKLRGLLDGDVRAGNAYVISVGSVHASGVMYELADDRPPAPLPEWLLDALKGQPAVTVPRPVTVPPARTGGSFVGLLKFVLESPQGERNNRLYWSACRAFERSDGQDSAVASALLDAARHIGLGENEARQTITSAYRSRAAR
ncbi:bifunctional DNA primase/polymerase [Streptomyces cellulosae]